MSGWVKLHRSIAEWEWYTDPNTVRLFFHLLIKANHKPKRWKGVEVNSGQLITSLDHLSIGLKLSVQQIRTSLNKLKSTNEITVKSTNKYTVVTISKWHVYQCDGEEHRNEKPKDQQADQQADQQTDNKQVTTNKNVKNTTTTSTREPDFEFDAQEVVEPVWPEASQNGAGGVVTIHDIQGVKDSRKGSDGPLVKPNKVTWYIGDDGLPELQITEQQLRVAQELFNGTSEQLVSELKNFVVDAWDRKLEQDLFSRLRNWIVLANRNLEKDERGASNEEDRRSGRVSRKEYWQLSADEKQRRIDDAVEKVQQSGIQDYF